MLNKYSVVRMTVHIVEASSKELAYQLSKELEPMQEEYKVRKTSE